MTTELLSLRRLESEIARNLKQSSSELPALSAEYLDRLLDSPGQETGGRPIPGRLTRARVHDNGFLKVLLVNGQEWDDDSLSGHRLVLHVWDTSMATALIENVHNHRWPFWSTSLCGRLAWEHYSVVTTDDVEPTHQGYRYTSPGDGESYSLVPTSPATLARQFLAVVEPGTTMAMGYEELHRVRRVGSRPVATMVLQGRPVRAETDVFVSADPATMPNPSVARLTLKVREHPTAATIALLSRLRENHEFRRAV